MISVGLAQAARRRSPPRPRPATCIFQNEALFHLLKMFKYKCMIKRTFLTDRVRTAWRVLIPKPLITAASPKHIINITDNLFLESVYKRGFFDSLIRNCCRTVDSVNCFHIDI